MTEVVASVGEYRRAQPSTRNNRQEHAIDRPEEEEEHGSSVTSAIFNFTNSVVGAGAIGLGGAIAQSGGFVSVLSIAAFALLTKLSLDLVIKLSVETEGANTYEDLGQLGFGWRGKYAVIISKFLYSFGCLVAYVVVVKDNLGPALRSLLYGPSHDMLEWELPDIDPASFFTKEGFYKFLGTDFLVTWTVSSLVILPLCFLRDMTPLASFSAISIVSMIMIVSIVIYLYICNPDDEIRQPPSSVYEDWLQVRWGYIECLGTFVFTFVSQHTVHLAFGSLKPSLRTVENWQRISSASIGLSAAVSTVVGLGVYISFWRESKSDIFQVYPATPMIDVAKLLLCITMLLTFPLPFFTCRELLIILSFPANRREIPDNVDDIIAAAMEEPLLENDEEDRGSIASDELANQDEDGSKSNNTNREDSMSLMDLSVLSAHAINLMNSCLLPGEERQLKLPYHMAMTGKLWVVVTGLAIAAPNLGDVLDLVGCATGTLIAFIFPACLAFRLQGYSDTALIILIVGGVVGVVGTIMSLKQLLADVAHLQPGTS